MKLALLLLFASFSALAQFSPNPGGLPGGTTSGMNLPPDIEPDPGMGTGPGYTGAGAASPQGHLNLSFLSNRQTDCSFAPKISSDDQALLTNAQQAVSALRNNDACKAMTTQMDQFQQAMNAYNTLNGINRAPGYDGNVAVTCANYEQLYDQELDHFATEWDSGSSSMNDPFGRCRTAVTAALTACGTDQSCKDRTRETAMGCGAMVTGRIKNSKRYECDKFATSINQSQSAALVADTYKKGMEAVQAILNNNDCIDSAGDQKLSFIQNAVSLAGRAASIGSLGGPSGVLIGAATGIISTVFKKIFDVRAEKKDNLLLLEKRENFTKVACLYEKLESKALRCERIAANREVEDTKKTNDAAKLCVEQTDKDFVQANKLIEETSEIMLRFTSSPAPAAPAPGTPSPEVAKKFDEASMNAIVESLSKPFPGASKTMLEVGTENANAMELKLNQLLSSDQVLTDFVKAQTKSSAKPSNTVLRATQTQLRSQLQKTKALKTVLKSIADADGKGTSMGAEDLSAVSRSMSAMSTDGNSFANTYNELLIAGVALNPAASLAEKLKIYNSKLDQSRVYKTAMGRYQNKQRLSEVDFDDNSNFSDARLALKPHLKKLLDDELNSLSGRAKDFKDVQMGPQSSATKEVLKKGEEEIIFPIMRACNKLQSIMNGRDGEFNPTEQHESCKAFNCAKGNKTFEDYKAAQGLKFDDKKCRSTECTGQYNRYICEERMKLPGVRNNLKSEFEQNGSLCGKSLSEAFGK